MNMKKINDEKYFKSEKDKSDIVDGLTKRGYDAFINNGNIIILYDGFVKTTPLDNVLNLLYDKLMPMSYI
jgi:hypothetical protein